MRDIKFRAWLPDDGKMLNIVSALSFFHTGKPSRVAGYVDDSNNFSDVALDINFELMQFTGLYDSEGVGIYEGDILQISDYSAPVEFNKSTAAFCVGLDDREQSDHLYAADSCKIIGNIHEHPELLEQSRGDV